MATESLPMLYSGLTQSIAGTTLTLASYGNYLLEGFRKFQESVEGFTSKEKIAIHVQTSNPLEKSPLKFRVDDPVSGLKERLTGLIEEQKKRAKGGDRGKEDDLLNMSHLGITLLNFSTDELATTRDTPLLNDSQNLLADLYPPDKTTSIHDLSLADAPNPRSVNDNLLDLADMYETESSTAQPRASYTSSKRGTEYPDQMSFKKPPGLPANSLRTTLTPQIQILNTQKLTATEKSPLNPPRSRPAEYGVQTPLRPAGLNRMSSASSQNSSMEKQAAKTAVEYSSSEYGGRSLRSPTVHSTAGTETGSTSSYSSGLQPSKSHQQYASSTKGSSKSGVNIAKTPSSDALLTLEARELMKNKVTHKAIPSKYHHDLFKFMDAVSRPYDFSDSQMGDSGVHFLWKYMKPGLEIDTLKLDNCKITNTGLSILLHGLTSIKVGKLYLRENQITKEGVDLLLYFVGTFKPIERLNLEGNLVDKSLLSSYVKEFGQQQTVLFL